MTPIKCWSCGRTTWAAPTDIGTELCAECAMQDYTISTWLDYYQAKKGACLA